MNAFRREAKQWYNESNSTDSDGSSNTDDSLPKSGNKRKLSSTQQYLKCWEKKYKWLACGNNVHSAYCTLCRKQFSITHGGQHDVKRHHIGKSHQKNYNAHECNETIVRIYERQAGIQNERIFNNDEADSEDQSDGRSPKKQKYLQQYLKVWEDRYKWLKSTDSSYRAYCLLCKKEFSIHHGGHHEVKRHEKSKGHQKRSKPLETAVYETKEQKYERQFMEGNYGGDEEPPKKISTFFINRGLECDKLTASHLALAFHCLKHNLSYSSMDCGNKLCKEIFSDTQITSKLSCGRTKAEMMVKNVLAPKSISDFIEQLQQKGPTSQFFSLSTGVTKVKGNRRMFLVCVKYFHPLDGVQNRLLNFVENSNESVDCIYNLLLENLRDFQLPTDFVTAYNTADEINPDFVKSHSMFQLLLNNRIIRVKCDCQILHNSLKYSMDRLSFDVETIITKIFTYFSFPSNEKINSNNLNPIFLEFVELEWPEIQINFKTKWISLMPAVEKLLKNWQQLKNYFSNLQDCPNFFQNIFQQNSGQEISYEIYLNFLLNIGNVLEKSTSLLERADVSALDCYKMMQNVWQKIQQRIEDQYFGFYAKQQMKKLPIHVQDYIKKDFNEFYQNLLKYLNSKYDFSDSNKISKLNAFSLNSKIQFQDFELAVEILNLENMVDVTKLYDEFCLAREHLHAISESNLSDISKWMKIFSIINPINIPNINSIVGFIFSIPGSNAHIEKIFTLMRNRWSDVRNRTSVEMIKSELQILTNFNMSCNEFYNFIKTDIKILEQSKSTTKYDHKSTNSNYRSGQNMISKNHISAIINM